MLHTCCSQGLNQAVFNSSQHALQQTLRVGIAVAERVVKVGARMRPLHGHRRILLCVLLIVCPLRPRAQTVASRSSTPGVIDSAPAPVTTQVGSRSGSQYPLGVADVIHVSVWKNVELSQTLIVGPDGFISMPLIGDIHVAGLTTNELARDLGQQLSKYMIGTPITVGLVETHSRQVFVTGQVGKPGAFAFVTPTTVLQAIAQAGGLSVFANRKKIFVLRTAASKVQRIRFDYANAVKGDPKQVIFLEPGDTVIVP
jgi:polysaccharide export outer membrane protein